MDWGELDSPSMLDPAETAAVVADGGSLPCELGLGGPEVGADVEVAAHQRVMSLPPGAFAEVLGIDIGDQS
ncbi:MAG TPA: hypothetical protein VF809_03455 [Candidatus Saccharimonadales bacterium]